MIISSGQRTDIPAFYSEWFMNRIREGYVMVRNPFYPMQVTRYRLTPDVADVLSFCTKNPEPMLPYIRELKERGYAMHWFVTITPYGKEIEPGVPDKARVMESTRKLSELLGDADVPGRRRTAWRYDPVLILDPYDVDYHIETFRKMAETLSGAVDQCVISFVDLYEKTRRNFPEVRPVRREERIAIGRAFAEIGKTNGITVRSCFEGTELAPFGVDISGCFTKEVLERAVGSELAVPKRVMARQTTGQEVELGKGCDCVFGHDIGAYNTCTHFCRYCYANYDRETVLKNVRLHDPESPFLVGGPLPGDEVHEAKQAPYRTGQYQLPFL